MENHVSLQVIAPAIGDVGLLGLRFLLCGPAEKILGGEPQTVRSHDSYEHVSVLVVDDVSHSISTDGIADLIIANTPVLPGYEPPGTNERTRSHCLFSLSLRMRSAPARIMIFYSFRHFPGGLGKQLEDDCK